MVNFTMYSETKVSTDDGMVRGIGEDALPYSGSHGMFVADGAGGVSVVDFSDGEKLFSDPGKFNYKKWFTNITGTESLKLLRYCIESFNGTLFDGDESSQGCMKTIYSQKKDKALYKRSGFFGSKALGIAMVDFLGGITDESDFVKEIRAFKAGLSDRFLDIIKKMNLRVDESSVSKTESFRTTLAAAVYRECPNGEVDVCYMSAGDSKIFVLDRYGLRQAVDDQGCNGRVMEMISKNRAESNEIRILLKGMKYSAPCIIMCMTDGFYDSFAGEDGFMSSPLYMEMLMLNWIISCDSFDSLREKLRTSFEKKSSVDDSHTISLTGFGMNSYKDLRDFAKMRKKFLYDIYQLEKAPPNFFAHDYSNENSTVRTQQKKVFDHYLKSYIKDLSDQKQKEILSNGWL